MLDVVITVIQSLALTIVVEALIATLMGVHNRQGQLTIVLAQVATNPVVVTGTLLNFALWLPLEVGAIVLEAFLYSYTGIDKHPVGLSVICNLTSIFIGLPLLAGLAV